MAQLPSQALEQLRERLHIPLGKYLPRIRGRGEILEVYSRFRALFSAYYNLTSNAFLNCGLSQQDYMAALEKDLPRITAFLLMQDLSDPSFYLGIPEIDHFDRALQLVLAQIQAHSVQRPVHPAEALMFQEIVMPLVDQLAKANIQLRRQAVAAETGGRDKDQTQMPGANEAGTPGDRGHSVEGAPANEHVSRASPEERLAGKTVVPYKTAAEVLNVGPRRIRQLVAKKQLISRGEGHQKKIDVASLRRRAGLQQTNPEQSGSKGK
jgi:hypothetical protein